jgi:hypothetical protein
MRQKVLTYLRKKGGQAFLARLIDDVDNGDLDVILKPREYSDEHRVVFAMSRELFDTLTILGESGVLALLDDDAMVKLAEAKVI